ncbi:MAG: 2-amino-4-hydroxy-6-hydroxymethyldihydropteridine diphosphokinase [Chitinophagaceae bacterium]|nr:2-amino-4-hydroxy-6-hydroxymethyldihydropteridine diphosphokinase [Rubrivivax sp.]
MGTPVPEPAPALHEEPGERVFVGLGANLGGDVSALQRVLIEATHQLAALPGSRVVARSSLYRTEPVGAAGPDFVNAVVEMRSSMTPQSLLRALLQIEAEHGRLRPFRHAPRSLDLDLLLFGQRVLDEPALTLPHPRLHRRAFVLEPLIELAPGLAHPRLGPLTAWREQAAGQRIHKLP